MTTRSGAQIPLRELASVEIKSGPSMLRNENGFLAAYVYADIAGRDVGSWVAETKEKVAKSVKLPVGTSLLWSGQYENMLRVKERLKLIIPITLVLFF